MDSSREAIDWKKDSSDQDNAEKTKDSDCEGHSLDGRGLSDRASA